MSDPKQTTTGEVIHTCGFIHPNTQPCPNGSINNTDGVKSCTDPCVWVSAEFTPPKND